MNPIHTIRFNFKKVFGFGLVFLGVFISIGGSAQVATLDSKKILATMPVFAKIDTLVLEETQKYTQEYAKKRYATQILLGIADSLYKKAPKDKKTEEAVLAADKSQQEFTALEKTINQKLADYKNLILSPYYDKVNAAVKAVATRLKYSQVLDIQQVPFVYIDPSKDITEEVIKQLITK